MGKINAPRARFRPMPGITAPFSALFKLLFSKSSCNIIPNIKFDDFFKKTLPDAKLPLVFLRVWGYNIKGLWEAGL
jgi:hypothetical protein